MTKTNTPRSGFKVLNHGRIVKLVRDTLRELDFAQDRPERYYDVEQIVKVITDTIVKGVKQDGFVTIEGLGRFYKKVREARTYNRMILDENYKRIGSERRMRKERTELGFLMCKAINRSLRDKEHVNQS